MRSQSLVAAATLAAVLCLPTVAPASPIAKVALMGEPAPGLSGLTFAGFDNAPAINASGQVVVTAALAGTGVSDLNNESIWIGNGDSFMLAVREGITVAEAGGNLSSFTRPAIDAAGNLVFSSLVTGPGHGPFGDLATFNGTPGSPSLVSLSGATAPGTPAVFNSLFFPLRVNPAGAVAFRATLSGVGVDPSNDQGIWTSATGSLQLLAREGNTAAGIPAVQYGTLNDPVINRHGHVAFSSSLTGATPTTDAAIWAGAAGSLSVVAREGDAAPGTTGAYQNFLIQPVLNNADQVAFSAGLTGAGVDATNDQGIWLGQANSLVLAARKGDAAPGAAPGQSFASFPGAPTTPLVLNGAGQIAFRATLGGTGVTAANDAGLWVGAPGSVDLLAREGDQAPGLPAGIVFAEPFPGGPVFSDPVLNERGQVAILASLAGPGVTSISNTALYATDPNGNLEFIARTGDLFDADGAGDMRTISGLTLFAGSLLASSGGQDGRPSPFNDRSELVFRAAFSDITAGIYIATVPEPAGIVLMSLGGAALVWAGRKRRMARP